MPNWFSTDRGGKWRTKGVPQMVFESKYSILGTFHQAGDIHQNSMFMLQLVSSQDVIRWHETLLLLLTCLSEAIYLLHIWSISPYHTMPCIFENSYFQVCNRFDLLLIELEHWKLGWRWLHQLFHFGSLGDSGLLRRLSNSKETRTQIHHDIISRSFCAVLYRNTFDQQRYVLALWRHIGLHEYHTDRLF